MRTMTMVYGKLGNGMGGFAGLLCLLGTSLLLTGCPENTVEVPSLVTVPDCAGMTIEEATVLLEESGLVLEGITLDAQSTSLAGTVIGQEPKAGTIVVAGSSIGVTISAHEDSPEEGEDTGETVVISEEGFPEIGYQAPDFTSVLADGSPFRLSDYRGSIVILDFWATWCSPCRASLPAYAQLAAQYAQHGVIFLTVDAKEEAARILSYLQSHGLAVPTVLDPNGTIMDGYDVSSLPTTFIIDESGVIRYIHEGFPGSDAVSGELDELLGKMAAAAGE